MGELRESIALDGTLPSGFHDRLGYSSKQGLTEADVESLAKVFSEWSVESEDGAPAGIPSNKVKSAVDTFVGAPLSEDTFRKFAAAYIVLSSSPSAPQIESKEGDDEEKKDAEGDEGDSGEADAGIDGEDGVDKQEEKGGEEKEVDEAKVAEDASDGKLLIDFDVFQCLACDIYAPAYVYGKEFSRAASRGDISAMEGFVERGCDPNYVDGFGFTALHYAAEAGSLTSVKYLLSAGKRDAIVDASDNSGWTPFMVAAASPAADRVKIMKELKSAGASATSISKTGRNALHIAALKGHKDVAQYLLSSGDAAAVKNTQDKSGWTPLHCAVINGETHVLEAIAPKVDKSLKDYNNLQARQYADDAVLDVYDKIVGGGTSANNARGKKK